MKDPTLLIRLVAIYLFALVGTCITALATYLFIKNGQLPAQLYELLVAILGAAFTLIGYHSNTLAAALVHTIATEKEATVVIEKKNGGTKATDTTVPP